LLQAWKKDVDARDERGHDGGEAWQSPLGHRRACPGHPDDRHRAVLIEIAGTSPAMTPRVSYRAHEYLAVDPVTAITL
jgi:hypothetical protein